MAVGRVRFDRFVLDADQRRLTCDGAPVELNARYFDALALLAGEPGRLVSKDRFMAEVWRGVPVTDEALTQCIRALRKALGDDAARPRFIETVPKHGYRFVADTTPEEIATPRSPPADHGPKQDWRERRGAGWAGMVGGGIAGVIGGVIYGFAGAASPGVGAASTFIVLVCLTTLVALIGGAGVGFGLGLAGYMQRRPSVGMALGAGLGGLLVGGLFSLVGGDAFTLLFGHAPVGVTGAPEGGLLGLAIGAGAALAGRRTTEPPLRLSMTACALTTGAAGMFIAWRGGRLMGGSLDALTKSFPDAHLRLDAIGGLFGEAGFGPVTLMVTSGLEGALFGACVVGAMIFGRRLV